MKDLALEQLRKLKSADEIRQRVTAMGTALTAKYRGHEPVCICVLNGSFMFYADLIRAIDLDVTCEFLGVSSYRDQKISSGEVEVTLDLSTPIKDKDVILIEDLVDSGLTMKFLIDTLRARQPRSLTTVALLLKPTALKIKSPLDLVGFEIADDFVVGYGIDFAGDYRQLPYLSTLPASAETVQALP